ncbi:hypothetical protein [Candidatus Pyrohabitans sp.]
MSKCGRCIRLDVCRFVHDPVLQATIDDIAERLMQLFDGIDEDEVRNAFWEGFEPLFGEKCRDFMEGKA